MPRKEPYKVELFNHQVQVPFLRKIVIEDELENMEENNPRLIHLKIRVLNDRIEEEKTKQINIVNYQENNIYKVIASFLCSVIMCLIIVIIEQFIHITWYLTLEDISIMDLKSVGAVFFFPLVLVLICAIIFNTGWSILLLKRTYVIEDPHDHVRKSYETVLKRSRERVEGYERKRDELRAKLINLR